jgi:hypothetical protein
MTLTADLDSALMDDTEAAPLTEEQTQSLRAWGQEDTATEVVDYRHRNWKLPVMLVSAALTAALAAGAYLAWPEPSPQVAAPAPSAAKPQVAPSKDDQFLALIEQRGVKVLSPKMMLNAGHFVCTAETQGHTDPEIADAFTRSTPGMNLKGASVLVDTAVEVYCPPPGVK